jgi:hypothetical protein
MLGHKDIKSTMTYINLESSYFGESNQDFHVKTAPNTLEAAKLLEVGFDYVCTDPQGTMIFRKPK